MKISSPNLNDMLSISIESNGKKMTKSGINPLLFPTLGHLGAKNANYSKLGIDISVHRVGFFLIIRRYVCLDCSHTTKCFRIF